MVHRRTLWRSVAIVGGKVTHLIDFLLFTKKRLILLPEQGGTDNDFVLYLLVLASVFLAVPIGASRVFEPVEEFQEHR